MKKIYITPNTKWAELHDEESLCVVSAPADSLPGSDDDGGLDIYPGEETDPTDGEDMSVRRDLWDNMW